MSHPPPTRSLRAGALALGLLALACSEPAAGGTGGAPAWSDSLPEAAAFGAPRGRTPVRAILHVHSLWSHDACDGEPFDEETGAPHLDCHARFRAALCRANVGVAFLTDHDRNVHRAGDIADAVYMRPGDRPVLVGGLLAANRVACPGDVAGVLLLAGSESKLMTIGLDSLPDIADRDARRRWFVDESPGAVEKFHRWGAIVLFPHPEDAPLSEIAALGPDLIEVYNPHANFAPKHRESQGLTRLGAIWRLLPFYLRTTEAHPDLALLAIFHANRVAIDRWDALLASGHTVWGYGASDAHENALPWTLADGDRGDSYFRMIPWVTNVLLVESDQPVERGDVTAIEDAVRAGRFYAAIEAWGTPVGFDFRLEGPDGVAEMGETVARAPGQRLVVEPPRVAGRGGARVRIRLYRIEPSGARYAIAEGPGPIERAVEGPGAYRVEVGIVPRQLAPYLGDDADDLMHEVVWIYSNPILVVEPETAPEAGPGIEP